MTLTPLANCFWNKFGLPAQSDLRSLRSEVGNFAHFFLSRTMSHFFIRRIRVQKSGKFARFFLARNRVSLFQPPKTRISAIAMFSFFICTKLFIFILQTFAMRDYGTRSDTTARGCSVQTTFHHVPNSSLQHKMA